MTTTATRKRWPLNFTTSNQTPGYYSDMEKPIFRWTLDDALESCQNDPDINADAAAAARRLTTLDEQQATAINDAVSAVVKEAMPRLTSATDHLAEKITTIVQLLYDGQLALPAGTQPHPADDQEEFPTPGTDDGTVCLHRTIYALTMQDAYHQLHPDSIKAWQHEADFLRNLDTEHKAALDAAIDTVCQEYDDQMACILKPVNERIWQVISTYLI